MIIALVFTACKEPGPELPPLTGTVSISGIAEVGQTLTATTALGGSGTISYQWKRGSTDIGTNSSTYIVQSADIGSTISVIVARSGYIGSVASTPTAIVPPALTGTVSITGTTEVGQTLTANTDSLDGSGNISYQWKQRDINIGTNSKTYTIQSTDVGSTITVTVTRSGYSGSVTSSPTAGIGFPMLTGTVSITGTTELGQTLTANTDSLGGTGTISYQWRRRGYIIGTNSSTYVLVNDDVGSTITITVTRSGYSGSVTSSPTAGVGLPPLTGTVSINGTAEVGQILTANTDSLGGSGTISYQWKQGTINIGTNSNTYTIQFTDIGSTITVTVTRSSNSGSITSVPTAIVSFTSEILNITGNTWVGQILVADTNSLDVIEAFSYVWKRGDTVENVNSVITNADQQIYTLTQADVSKYLSVTLTANNTSNSVTSAPVGPITAISHEISVSGSDLATKLTWLKNYTQSNTVYLITVDKDESPAVSGISLDYTGKSNIIIRLEGIGDERTINSRDSLTVGNGVTLILDNNITLQGGYKGPLATVAGTLEMKSGAKIYGGSRGGVYVSGTFTMSGGKISGNRGGGVCVQDGTFTMSGGEISGNSSSATGGGVYVNKGIFTMSGGKISGNFSGYGGGVCVQDVTFTMSGGEISGNIAYSGGGVCVAGGIFTKTGGIVYGYTPGDSSSNIVKNNSGDVRDNSGHAVAVISGNDNYPIKRRESTAGPTDNMDSTVEGTAGGWE